MHARRMRYLIIGSERSALAAESGAASVSYGVSEWGLVWVSAVGLPEAVAVAVGVGVTVGVAVEVAVAVAVACGTLL